MRRGEEEESEVERIQELFPHDDLRLHERDPVTQVRRPSSGARRYSRQVVRSFWAGVVEGGKIVGSDNVGGFSYKAAFFFFFFFCCAVRDRG